MPGVINLDQKLAELRRLRDRVNHEIHVHETAAAMRRQAAEDRTRAAAEKQRLQREQAACAADARRASEQAAHTSHGTDAATQARSEWETRDAELRTLAPSDQVRAWARSQGIPIADRGRIAADLRRAYLNATGGHP